MGTEPTAVNRVGSDGRIKLPPEIAEKYDGKHMAIYDRDGSVCLEVVNHEQ